MNPSDQCTNNPRKIKTVLVTVAVFFLASLTSLHAADEPAGKVYVYKESAGKPRKMELYFPPNHDGRFVDGGLSSYDRSIDRNFFAGPG